MAHANCAIVNQMYLFDHDLTCVKTAVDTACGDSGEGEHWFRRERERHSGPKANSARSVATLASRLCR